MDGAVAKATVADGATASAAKSQTVKKPGGDAMSALKALDDLDVIPNAEAFECVICFLDIEPGDGVVLRECLHTFCGDCLSGAIQHSDEAAGAGDQSLGVAGGV